MKLLDYFFSLLVTTLVVPNTQTFDHFGTIDLTIKVNKTGENSCWIDAFWAQATPDQKGNRERHI